MQCFGGAWHFGEAACSVLEGRDIFEGRLQCFGGRGILEDACSVLEGRGILEKLLAVFWRGVTFLKGA